LHRLGLEAFFKMGTFEWVLVIDCRDYSNRFQEKTDIIIRLEEQKKAKAQSSENEEKNIDK
jgi:hypothetical protein